MKNKARLLEQCLLAIMLLVLTAYAGESSPTSPDLPDYAIVQVSAGGYHSLGLRQDGTVVATGGD